MLDYVNGQDQERSQSEGEHEQGCPVIGPMQIGNSLPPDIWQPQLCKPASEQHHGAAEQQKNPRGDADPGCEAKSMRGLLAVMQREKKNRAAQGKIRRPDPRVAPSSFSRFVGLPNRD